MTKGATKGVAALALAETLQATCIGVRIGRLQRVVNRRYADALRRHGLTLPQMEVLATLILHGEPVRPTALADEMALERSTVSRNLALMTEAGWIEAAELSPGRRAMAVAITAAGSAKLTEARAAWDSAQSALVDELGGDVVRTLDRWLAKLA